MDNNFSTEKAILKVIRVHLFSLPEKTGEVIQFENDLMVPDGLADTEVDCWTSENVELGDDERNSPMTVPIA